MPNIIFFGLLQLIGYKQIPHVPEPLLEPPNFFFKSKYLFLYLFIIIKLKIKCGNYKDTYHNKSIC